MKTGKINLLIACVSFIIDITSTAIFADESIRQTIFPDEDLKPGKTTLWCPSFQFCWDNLKEMHKVEAINLEPKNPYGDYLNQFQWDSDKSLPPRDLVAIVGEYGPKFVETVNVAMRRHFGEKSNPLDPKDWKNEIRGGIAVLTVIKRSINFDSGFDARTDQSFAFFNNHGEPSDVQAFGSWTPRQRQNNAGSGRVLAYVPQKKLALALKTSDPEEFVVVMRDPDLKSIMAAITETKALLKALPVGTVLEPIPKDSYITNLDTILIPQLKLNSFGEFEKMLSGTYTTPDTPDQFWTIAKAIQNIDLSLDQSGADMEVRTFIVAPTFLSAGANASEPKNLKKPVPRNFIYNKPFFLMFWRKNGTVPYLACYVDTGGLVPWGQK